jgi:predicted ribosomally synthesized peptide with nif11-like leader
MTIEAAERAIDRMETDESLAEGVKEAGSPEAGISLLRAQGFDVSVQDMRDATLDRFGDQLTPEQLDAVAAGMDGNEALTLGLAAIGVWLMACAAVSV